MTSEVAHLSSISFAAHELKAPLSVLRQLTFALECAKSESDRHLLTLEMRKVSERALRQVSDLSKIARLEDGLFAMEPIAVRGLCDEVASELAKLFSAENRRLVTSYKNHSRLAIANRELLRSVVYNFCSNAVHYSGPGTSSELKISDHRGKVRIAVRDFGPALPVHIWRELRAGRLARPTSIAMRPGSSGLGLYIASHFSDYMHAQMGAIRHRDGSSFFIDLPVSTQMSLL